MEMGGGILVVWSLRVVLVLGVGGVGVGCSMGERESSWCV